MKIKIVVPGWECFTGLFGTVEFENGVSARDVTPREAMIIGANLKIENVDTNEQLGITTVNNGDVEAPILVDADNTPDPELEETTVEEAKEEEKVETEAKTVYTKEQLEEIADTDGIKGVRDIAKRFDVKGVQISQLIEGILKAQGE